MTFIIVSGWNACNDFDDDAARLADRFCQRFSAERGHLQQMCVGQLGSAAAPRRLAPLDGEGIAGQFLISSLGVSNGERQLVRGNLRDDAIAIHKRRRAIITGFV